MVLRLVYLSLVLSLIPSLQSAEVYSFKKLLLAKTEAEVTALPETSGGSAVAFAAALPEFNEQVFLEAVQKFVGQPIGTELLNALATAVAAHAQKHDRLGAKVAIPVQNVENGTLRFAVIYGHYNQLSFRGNRWFSSKLLEDRMGIKPGDEIRLSTLEDAVTWLNTNPFRQIKVLVNEIPNEPGKADLIIGVEERRPFRAAFSVDDTGNPIIGKHRMAGSFMFGNVLGRDHQASYQYLTTDETHVYQGHAIDYRIPLRWRHFLQVSANYVQIRPTFDEFSQKGETTVANLRYTVPLRSGPEASELSFGANFKRSNNNLEFGGREAFSSSSDIFQLTGAFSTIKRDRYGAWLFSFSANASPGDVNSRNTDAALQRSRNGASAKYLYGTFAIQRGLNLGKGWEAFGRGVIQRASTNLIASEQLAIGGSGSVRGYDENVYAAENGFVLSTELLAPVWTRRLPAKKIMAPLQGRALAFLDIGNVEYRNSYVNELTLAPLASTGFGLRASLGNNFSFTFDYGWQLTHLARQRTMLQRPPLSSRGHLKVVLAF